MGVDAAAVLSDVSLLVAAVGLAVEEEGERALARMDGQQSTEKQLAMSQSFRWIERCISWYFGCDGGGGGGCPTRGGIGSGEAYGAILRKHGSSLRTRGRVFIE